MRKIEEYYIVSGTSVEGLNKEVGDWIKRGFQPSGSIITFTRNYQLLQAMVRYEPEKPVDDPKKIK